MKTKLALFAAMTALTVAAPAIAANDETTAAKLDEVVLSNAGAGKLASPLIADADDPARTGGGSHGYNVNVHQDS